MKKKEKIYVIHFCKNKECNNAWIDLDLTNAKSRPPRWKYCSECCKKYGFTNPDVPPKKILTEKQQRIIEQYKFSKRKKSIVLREIDEGGILYQNSA